jgi:ankyrin repeat protein
MSRSDADELQEAFDRRDWRSCVRIARSMLDLTLSVELRIETVLKFGAALELQPNASALDLREAASRYEELLSEAASDSSLATSIHRRLGSVYETLAESGAFSAYTNKSITHYREAIRRRIDDHVLRASVQVRLAATLLCSTGADKRWRWHEAQLLLQEALEVFTPEHHLDEYDEAKALLASLTNLTSSNNPSDAGLVAACGEGELVRVRALLESGIHPDSRDKDGNTGLHLAAAGGHVAIVEVLQAFGADPLLKDNNGLSLLHWAVLSNDSRLMQMCLVQQLGINPRDRTGRSPLTWAISLGAESAFKWLLEKGADLSAADKDGWSPMHYAAAEETDSFTDALLRAGATPTLVSNAGESPCEVASRLRRRRNIQRLCK